MKATIISLSLLVLLLISLAFRDMVISFVSIGQQNLQLPSNIILLQIRAIAITMLAVILGATSFVFLVQKMKRASKDNEL